MAYLKADLLTDGEPATKALAEEICKRVLKDRVELRVIIAPRYSSQTLGSVGKAQDLLARQVRTLRADLSAPQTAWLSTLSLPSAPQSPPSQKKPERLSHTLQVHLLLLRHHRCLLTSPHELATETLDLVSAREWSHARAT
eukprot:5336411-Amphidinium_carterae.1